MQRTIARDELAKITYLNPDAVQGRSLLMMPLWENGAWHQWVDISDGTIIKIQVVDTIHSNYVAKEAARDNDIWIGFVDVMWQRASYPDISRTILSICDDFHLLATSSAKLDHYYAARETIDGSLISSFVKTELEYLITVARSVFDLLQEVFAALWNEHTRLVDPALDAIRKRHRLPGKFTKVAFHDRKLPKTVDELIAQYALPPILAEQYVKYAPFYTSLLAARDKIIHSGKSVDTIFVTEKGFCVDPKSATFSDFAWQEGHHYNENLVSLLPWVADVVFRTIEACNDMVGAFNTVVPLMEEVAPGYRVFIRDPANDAILRLWAVENGKAIFWSDHGFETVQPSSPAPKHQSKARGWWRRWFSCWSRRRVPWRRHPKHNAG